MYTRSGGQVSVPVPVNTQITWIDGYGDPSSYKVNKLGVKYKVPPLIIKDNDELPRIKYNALTI